MNSEQSMILKKKRKNGLQAKLFIVLSLAIPIMHFLVFWLYVNYNSILMAFQTVEAGEVIFSMKTFHDVFRSVGSETGELGLALKNTLILWGYNILVFPLGIFWAYFFYKKMPCKSFFRFMFYVPVIVSSVVISALYKYMLNPDGPIGVLFAKITNAPTPAFFVQTEYALGSIIIYDLWTGFAGNLLLLGGAMARIPVSVIESARLDGVGWIRELFQIFIPCIWSTLSTLIVLLVSGIFGTGGSVLLLTGGQGDTTTISYWMYKQVKIWNSYHMPSAFGLLLTFIATPLTLLTRFIVNRIYKDVEV